LNEGSYTIRIEDEKKMVEIVVIGTFDDNKAQEFHKEYLSNVLPLVANEYILRLDSTDMDVITPDMLPKLQISFALYKKSGFKEIHFIVYNRAIRDQLTRMIKFAGITNSKYIIPGEEENESN
jgi:hypothetical protein